MDAKTARRAELGKPPSSTPAQLADPGRKDRDVPATLDSDCSVSIPGRSNPHAMDEHRTRITRTSGMNPWRAGCGESRTSGSEGGPGRPTSREADRAPRPDPYTITSVPLGADVVAFATSHRTTQDSSLHVTSNWTKRWRPTTSPRELERLVP